MRADPLTWKKRVMHEAHMARKMQPVACESGSRSESSRKDGPVMSCCSVMR